MGRWGALTAAAGLVATVLVAVPARGLPWLSSPAHLATSTFSVFIADNSRHGLHRAGCNGVVSLTPFATGVSLLVPECGGLNFEVVSLSRWPPADRPRPPVMEPRDAPMHIAEADGRHVVLIQPETAHSNISARIEFWVEEPASLHQSIELTVHRVPADHATNPVTLAGLFASYIYRPRDPHIYLKAEPDSGPNEGWVGITKRRHNSVEYEVRAVPADPGLDVAGHLAAMGREPDLSSDDQRRRGWAADRLPRNTEGPLDFFYGFAHDDHLMLFIFRQGAAVRLSYSPTGGGGGSSPSPAWDFRPVVDRVQAGKTYRWDMCLVVKPFAGRDDVLAEVARYRRRPMLRAGE